MTSSEPCDAPASAFDLYGEVEALAREAAAAPEDAGVAARLSAAMAQADAARGLQPRDGQAARPGSPGFRHAMASFHRRHLRLDQAIETCRQGAAADPHDIALRQLWLEALFAARRLEEAGPAIAVPEDVAGGSLEAGAVALLLKAGQLLEAEGLTDLALEALERARRIRPDSSQLQVRLLSLAAAAASPDRAEAYREAVRQSVASALPERLAEGLAGLWGTRDRTPLPDAAVDWAWSLADKSAWSFEAWRAEVDWATRSRQLLRQWWTAAPAAAVAEIAELVDAPDLSAVRAIEAEGRAQVMAGAHCGPTWAAVHILQACGLSFRALGAAGLQQLNASGHTTIQMREQRAGTTREVLGEVRRGALIGIMADRALRDDRVAVDFLGRRAELSSLPARLARRYGCPTWWCAPLWCGERIVIELERLPDPDPEEPEDAWIRRWCRAYLDRLEEVMRGDPRNLDLTKGIWRATAA